MDFIEKIHEAYSAHWMEITDDMCCDEMMGEPVIFNPSKYSKLEEQAAKDGKGLKDAFNPDIKSLWYIKEDGGIYCPEHDYEIDKDELEEDDWILHLQTKGWFSFELFMPVYLEACRRAGIKKLNIRISY